MPKISRPISGYIDILAPHLVRANSSANKPCFGSKGCIPREAHPNNKTLSQRAFSFEYCSLDLNHLHILSVIVVVVDIDCVEIRTSIVKPAATQDGFLISNPDLPNNEKDIWTMTTSTGGTRHQRKAERLQTLKATKRYQAAQARKAGDSVPVVTETTEVTNLDDSKPIDEVDDSISDAVDYNEQANEDMPDAVDYMEHPSEDMPESPALSRVDEVEVQEENKAEARLTDEEEESPVVIDLFQDVSHEKSLLDSPKAHRKSYDGDQTPKTKTLSRMDETKDATPGRRFDIVEDGRPHRGNKSGRTNKTSLRKKSSKGRVSRGQKRSKRVRIKQRSIDDDASSVDSQLESYLSEDRSDGMAGALDHIIDYFTPMDDSRSLDDSYAYSERTERTDRTEETYANQPLFDYSFFSSKSKGGLLKDVEDLFMDRFSCGPAIPECQDLGTQTFSYAEDESTVSAPPARKIKPKRRPTRSKRSSRKPASKEADMPSVDLSTINPEDETETGTLTTKGESLSSKVLDGSLATSTYDTDKDIAHYASFDTAEQGRGCNIVGCLEPTTEAKNDFGEGQKAKIRDLLLIARRHAEQATKDLRSETSSLFSPSIASSKMSWLRDSTTVKADAVDAVDAADTTFTDVGTAFTDGAETQSIIQQPPVSDADVALKIIDEETSKEPDSHSDNNLYAPAQSIKTSASFYSVDTSTSQKKDPETAFQKAFSKLRDDTVLASKRLQDFQQSLQVMDFAPAGNVSITEKVKQVFTCSPEPHEVDEMPAEESKRVTAVETLKNVFTCSDVNRQDSILVEAGPDVAVGVSPATEDDANNSIAGDEVERQADVERPEEDDSGTPCASEPFGEVVKPVTAEGDSSETRSVQTKDTSRSSTEDEGENESPEHCVIEDAPLNKSMQSQETFQSQQQSTMEMSTESKSPKKWRKLRRMSKLVRPLFRTKRHSAKNSPAAQSSSEQNTSNSSGADSAVSPFDPSLSMKAKREAWRSSQNEFDEIISDKARANDWVMFPEFVNSSNVDAATKASI